MSITDDLMKAHVPDPICYPSLTELGKKHIDHANARWEVWQKGYALLCDVQGVLYVYAAELNREEEK